MASASGLAANAAPTDVSEARGKFLGGQVRGIDLDAIAEIGGADAANPSGEASDTNPLDVTVLNAVEVEVTPRLQLFGDNGIITLGAVQQYAEAEADGDAFAGSGAVTNSGAIAIDDDPPADGVADATVDLMPLLDPASIEVFQELSLKVGALASVASQVDGGAPASDYQIDGLSLNLTSDDLAEVGILLADAIDELDGIAAALEASLSADLPGATGVDAEVNVTLPDLEALRALLQTDQDGIQIDLVAGTVTVDINAFTPVNGLDPNTEILSPEVVEEITNAIAAQIAGIVDDVTAAIFDAVDAAELDGTVVISALVNDETERLTLALGGTLLDPEATVNAGAFNVPILDALDSDGPALEILFETAIAATTDDLEALLTNLDLVTLTLDDDLQDLIIAPLIAVLAPGAISLIANQQPTELDPAEDGDLGAGSFTVRALQVNLLSLVDDGIITVNLASSTVRGTDGAVDTPVAEDDELGADPADDSAELDVLDNDEFDATDDVTVEITEGPTNGTAVYDPTDEVVVYTPDDDFEDGTDTFTYELCNSEGECDTALVTITVGAPPVVGGPEAVDDEAEADPGEDIEIDVLDNDTVDPNDFTIAITDGPDDGTATVDPDTGIVTYTSDDDFEGTDTFTYELCNAADECDAASVIVIVGADDGVAGPNARNDYAQTDFEERITIGVWQNDSDEDGDLDQGSVTIVEGPDHGDVRVRSDGSIVYTPDDGFGGRDRFRYQVCDLTDRCDTAQVTVDVRESTDTDPGTGTDPDTDPDTGTGTDPDTDTGADDAPEIATPTVPNGVKGTGYSVTIAVTGGAPITFAVTQGSLPPGLSLDPVSGTISGTPTGSGLFGFTVTATNEYGSDSQTFSVDVLVPGSTGGLPKTGSELGTPIGASILALLGGLAIVLVSRRRNLGLGEEPGRSS